MRILVCFSIGALLAAAAYGQAAVEHSAATAGAAAAAPGAKAAGKSIGGVFRNLSDAVDKSGSTSKNGAKAAESNATAQSVRAKEPPAPVSKPVDPAQITIGLERAELIERFGPPVLSMSETEDSQMIERLWYNTTSPRRQVEIRLIGGKVASINPPPAAKPEVKN